MMTSAIGNRRAAFTLFELCLVISLIGMIASLSWPSMRRTACSIRDRAAAMDAVQQKMWAREKAIQTGRED
jgi:Tfp pilus assembly protein FimT